VQTWPRSLDQLPPMMDYNLRHGRTYMYFQGDPLYPFGYGLSYTRFRYSNLRTSASSMKTDGKVTLSVDVANTGAMDGDEVVQLYVRHPSSKVERPNKELRGFQRVTIPRGQKRTVTLTLEARSLAYWDEAQARWAVEASPVQMLVGGSSADLKLEKTIRVLN
jgi:beta-glucosidase